MTVARPRSKKPTAAEETARVLRIARMIDEELRVTNPDDPIIATLDVLAVADRIAARTED